MSRWGGHTLTHLSPKFQIQNSELYGDGVFLRLYDLHIAVIHECLKLAAGAYYESHLCVLPKAAFKIIIRSLWVL
jgi:hypothetical protein